MKMKTEKERMKGSNGEISRESDEERQRQAEGKSYRERLVERASATGRKRAVGIELMMYSVRPQYRQATQCETATHLQRNTPITFPAVGKQTHAHTHTPTLEKSNK